MKQGYFAEAMNRRLQVGQSREYIRFAVGRLSQLEKYGVYCWLERITNGRAAAILGARHLSPGAQACLRELRREQARHGRVATRQETIARRMGCSVISVKRYIAELRDAQVISIERRGARTQLYSLLNHSDAVMFDTSSVHRVGASGVSMAFHRGKRKLRETLEDMGFTQTHHLIGE